MAGKHATKHWANASSLINAVLRKRNNVQTSPPQRKTHTKNFLWTTLQLCPLGFRFGNAPNQKCAQKRRCKSHQPQKTQPSNKNQSPKNWPYRVKLEFSQQYFGCIPKSMACWPVHQSALDQFAPHDPFSCQWVFLVFVVQGGPGADRHK